MKHYIIIALLSFATVGAMKAETGKDKCLENCKTAQNPEECRKLCSETEDISVPVREAVSVVTPGDIPRQDISPGAIN